MIHRNKSVIRQIWDDFVAAAGFFISFCGVVSAVISLVNACSKSGVLSEIPIKVESKK